MAVDEDRTRLLRECFAAEGGADEQAMFGGLAFLVGGHIAVALTSKAELLVRVGVDGQAEALMAPHARIAVMGSREMRGWVRVGVDGLSEPDEVREWVRRGARTARSLPAKG